MYNFDAPIPGQSLTSLPGSSPMEHPPQFPDPQAALEYVWTQFTNPKHATRVILMLKKGIPVEFITNTVLFQGVMAGKWTVDTALLMYQVVFWQIESIAKLKKIKYQGKNVDVQQQQFLSQFVDLLDKPDTAVPTATPTPSLFKGLS